LQSAVLASDASPTALHALLYQALNKPLLLSFLPILLTPTVAALSASPSGDPLLGVYKLMCIFSRGGYADYLEWKKEFPGECVVLF
jgi:hypothetical protein